MALSHFSLGIDPGTQGGFALISADRQTILLESFTYKIKVGKKEKVMHRTLDELNGVIREWSLWGKINGFIELVGARPGDGTVSLAKFMIAYGFAQGLLYAHEIPHKLVTPGEWQRAMALGGKYPSKWFRKKAHREKAKKLFPKLADQITIENADALLIAEFAWRMENIGNKKPGR
jgi:Holliday junction resolvasome RuvABC endonuclease subunit